MKDSRISREFVRKKLRELLNEPSTEPKGFVTAPGKVFDQAIWVAARVLGVDLKENA